MGGFFSTNSVVKKECVVKKNMKIIMWYWLLKEHIDPFPVEIIDLIVNIYCYQKLFESRTNTPNHSMPGQSYNYLIKLLLCGDANVGKTCLLTKYIDGYYDDNSFAFKCKMLNARDKIVKIHIWDSFKYNPNVSCSTPHFLGLDGIIFVHDITNIKSLSNLLKWNSICNKFAPKHVKKIIIGNKCDLQCQRQCFSDEILQVALECNIEGVMETSAKNNTNVDESIMWLTEQVIDTVDSDTYPFIG
eukprot:337010_1